MSEESKPQFWVELEPSDKFNHETDMQLESGMRLRRASKSKAWDQYEKFFNSEHDRQMKLLGLNVEALVALKALRDFLK